MPRFHDNGWCFTWPITAANAFAASAQQGVDHFRAAPIALAGLAFCRERLAHFKCPRRVVFGTVPRTATGKIQKFKLREQAGSREAITKIA